MTNVLLPKTSENRVWDLEERTAKFGEDIIRFAKKFQSQKSPNGLFHNWLVPGQALEQIIAKQMMQNLQKILFIKLGFVKKNPEK